MDIVEQNRSLAACYPPQSDMLWLRLSVLARGEEQVDYLEKALRVNPWNKQTLRLLERICPERARKARAWLDCFCEVGDPP